MKICHIVACALRLPAVGSVFATRAPGCSEPPDRCSRGEAMSADATQVAPLTKAPRPALSTRSTGARAWQHASRRSRGRRRRVALGGGWLLLVLLAGTLVWTSTWWQPPAPVGML